MEAIGKTKGAVDFFGKYANAAEQIYRKEDHIFRLAIMKQRLDLGLDAKVLAISSLLLSPPDRTIDFDFLTC